MTPSGIAYLGTWDFRKQRGADAVTIARRDADTGALEALSTTLPGVSVGAMHLDETRGVLYCLDEASSPLGGPPGGGGTVYAFAVDAASGGLTELSRCPSYGSLPSYVTTDASGRHLLVTNHTTSDAITSIEPDANGGFGIVRRYDSATIVLYDLDASGAVARVADVVTLTGRGALPGQTHPRPHSVVRSPSGSFFVVCDKGADRVLTLRISAGRDADARSRIEVVGEYATPPGSSPRYAAFHPRRPLLFVNHESAPLVASYRYTEAGVLELIGTVAVTDDPAATHTARQSDLCLHPDGSVLYSLMRGSHEIAVLDVDADGGLGVRSVVPAGGRNPRGCAVSPDGRCLYVAAVDTDEIVVWSLAADGHPDAVMQRLAMVSPGVVTLGSAVPNHREK